MIVVTDVNMIERIHQLRSRFNQQMVAADEAIAAYATRVEQLRQRGGGDPIALRIAKRDDPELGEIGRRAEFHTAQANRLGVALTVALLSRMTSPVTVVNNR